MDGSENSLENSLRDNNEIVCNSTVSSTNVDKISASASATNLQDTSSSESQKNNTKPSIKVSTKKKVDLTNDLVPEMRRSKRLHKGSSNSHIPKSSNQDSSNIILLKHSKKISSCGKSTKSLNKDLAGTELVRHTNLAGDKTDCISSASTNPGKHVESQLPNKNALKRPNKSSPEGKPAKYLKSLPDTKTSKNNNRKALNNRKVLKNSPNTRASRLKKNKANKHAKNSSREAVIVKKYPTEQINTADESNNVPSTSTKFISTTIKENFSQESSYKETLISQNDGINTKYEDDNPCPNSPLLMTSSPLTFEEDDENNFKLIFTNTNTPKIREILSNIKREYLIYIHIVKTKIFEYNVSRKNCEMYSNTHPIF